MRGYVIAADKQFLEPYYDGQKVEQRRRQKTFGERVGDRDRS